MVYSTAVGCSCLLGAGHAPLRAAEWSVQPSFSWAADYDSNRVLSTTSQSSDEGTLSGDLKLRRTLESTDISLEPRITLRRFTDTSYGDGDDRTLNAGFSRTWEQTQLNLTAFAADQSTLTTELLETGLVSGNTHRRTYQGGAVWSWSQTERRQTFLQLNYSDVSYQGQFSNFLPGYKYPVASLGERFTLSDRSTFTVSAFGDALSTSVRNGNSHEAGIQLELVHSFSERTSVDASVGESQRSLTGTRSYGTNASVSLTHNLVRGNVGLSYTRSLVPYGTGYLVQRQLITASGMRPITPYLNADVSFSRVQNPNSVVILRVDRRSYDSGVIGLNWRTSDTWTLRTEVGASRTQPFGSTSSSESVHEWRAALTMTWTPLPSARSR
jgi:hypothetical protein